MLTALTVQNLVVVREIDVELAGGLTVLTGETGAGKSVLIEALALALGDRADSQMIRAGTERATVVASFDVGDNPPARAFLDANALAAGDECVLRRVIGRDGRSRAFCNGTPVAVQTLRELGALLVDIHSQHASHRLTERERQRELLDAYGQLETPVAAVAKAHAAWRAAADALDALEQSGRDRARLDLLRYQVDELDALRVTAEELATIEDEHRRLANSATTLEHCAAVDRALRDDEAGATRTVQAALHHARLLERLVPEARNLRELLEQAVVALDEVDGELARVERAAAADPACLERIDRRLAELHAIARKHRVPLDRLGALAQDLQTELAALEARSGKLETLRAEVAAQLENYSDAAGRLSKARRRAAKAMNTDITRRLRDLGIPHAEFDVEVSPAPPGQPQSHGQDRVEFRVTTNPDLTPGALNKVASGGELSRIGLAIQATTAGRTGVPVVVYDEVDTGIGGNTANVVGRNLREVARHCQVLCITHSPQVASAGQHHLLVDKQVSDGQAETRLVRLDDEARVAEIARMLGAARATSASRAHARDLLVQGSAD